MVKKRHTIEYVKQYIEKNYSGSICLSSEYINNKTKLSFTCCNNHNFNMTFDSVISGRWCSKCANKKNSDAQRLNIEHVRLYLKEHHPDAILISKEYINSRDKLDIICEHNHSFKMNFNSIQQNKWCRICSIKRLGLLKRRTISQIEEFIKKHHFGAVLVSKEYTGICDNLNFKCENNHNFTANFNNILQGKWCPHCSCSKSEKYIKSIFEKLTNKSFNKIKPAWLVNDKTNCKLELDGFNEELKIAFECQGEQHYIFKKRYHKNNDGLEYQQYKDELKKKLCKNNGVKLICIPALNIKINGILYKEEIVEKIIKDFLINNGAI